MSQWDETKVNQSIDRFKQSLQLMGVLFKSDKKLRKEIYNEQTGFIFDARYQFKTRDGKVNHYLIFNNGEVKSGDGTVDNPNITIWFKNKEIMAKIWDKSPDESLNYLLTNEMSYTGNMSYLTRFSYITSAITGARIKDYKGPENRQLYPISDIDKETRRRLKNETLGRKVDKVQFLKDPYLGKYSIDDFPRLKCLKNRRYALKPAICVERAKLLTEFHKANGFETDKSGKPIVPELRQAKAINYIMTNRKPIIHDKYLIPGSTTTKEVGIPIYPELIGTAIWPELKSINNRELNPNDISPEDADILDFEILPYWMDRNVREYCRKKYNNPISQQLEERFVLYFMMKNNAISHTVPGLNRVLTMGFEKIKEDAAKREKESTSTEEKKDFYEAVQIVIDGVLNHARNLSKEALRLAGLLDPKNPEQARRIEELKEISRISAKVPAKPADTMHEAIASLWITWTCIHSENANSAMSIGRLDQMLQPFLAKDMSKAKTDAEREGVVKRAVDLVGQLFLRINDDDPLVPSVGNKLFGGSSSDDTVTVGGVDKQGNNAVNDMTYVILKTAEMLCFQDPNMNARYYPGVNSREYLRRLCEVNINMVASPAIHNDKAMIEALVHQGIPIEDARDWAATGCVEPTISGKHYGHTNCMLLNMVAPLEMALNNGVHPVMGDRIGPETGDVRNSFKTFEDFYDAYKSQLRYLAEKSIEINNYLGYSHQYVHPTPLLSSLYEGPLEKGTDIINGGAVYNTSGVALVSLTDVVDSLLVIRDLIYKKKQLDWSTLMHALETNFENGTEQVLRKIQKVPRFGSDEPGTSEIAHNLIDFCYDIYNPAQNYRGGNYLVGYWSISYHVGFGMLSGALPSGRKKGKAFTPGLTPAPGPSDQLLQNIHTIAKLNYLKMPNNASFNVKLVPHANDSHAKTLDLFTSYVQSYFDLGGMQWQFNVVTSDTLRDAVKNPDNYRWLLVRVSGYNAYFVKINKNMQQELIERTEFCAR